MTTESTADGNMAPETPEIDNVSKSEKIHQGKSYRDSKTWERALFMLLFGILGYFTFMIIVLIAVVQIVVKLVTRESNEDLRSFSRNLAEYLRQIASYLGFASDEKPCPFSPFPRVDPEV